MIKFLVMDVDGTLTDGKVYMGNSGEVFKAFNIKDGCGIKEILPIHAVIPVIITARESQMLVNRCIELGVKEIHQGVREKLVCLQSIIDKYSSQNEKYNLSNVAYIGDDLLDLKCFIPIKEAGGLTGCPADSIPEVISSCDFVSPHNGGDGAVRDFIEFIVQNNIGVHSNNEILHVRINNAIKYISKVAQGTLLPGKYLVDDGFYYTVQKYLPADSNDSMFESHKRHIDIQWIISGKERLYVSNTSFLKAIDYDSDNDVLHYDRCNLESSVIFACGSSVVLLPQDAHRSEKIEGVDEMVVKIVGKLLI